MNKKRLSILFLIAIGVMLVINLVFFTKNDNKSADVQEDNATEETKDDATSEREETNREEERDPLEDTKKATALLYREHITPIGSGEEYPIEKAKALKSELLSYATKGEYGALLNKANTITENYRFSEGINLDIAGIIYDAGIVVDAYEDGLERLEFGEVVASSKTPEMLIASSMWSDHFARRAIFQDFSSLAPSGIIDFEFKESRVLRNEKDAEGEPNFKKINKAKEIFTLEDNVNSVYAYDAHLNFEAGLPVTIYVVEDLFGNIKFYGMYAEDHIKHYAQDLEWWSQHDVLFENAEKAQEEYYKKQGEEGVITNEQLDRLFESGY